MSRKYSVIEQLDENGDHVANNDDQYSRTKLYWKTGRLTTMYQSFLDANCIIKNSDLEEEIKLEELENILEARKCAFGEDYRYYPPSK